MQSNVSAKNLYYSYERMHVEEHTITLINLQKKEANTHKTFSVCRERFNWKYSQNNGTTVAHL